MDTKIAVSNFNNISNRTGNRPSFGSKNCPVEPFTVKTNTGTLHVEEAKACDIVPAATFLAKSSIETYADYADEYNARSPKAREYYLDNAINSNINSLEKSGHNSTVLVGKDNHGNIKSLFTMEELDLRPLGLNIFDTKTGYIDECMVDSKYRSGGVGNVLIEKLIETTKGQFDDVILFAKLKARAFFNRHGFKTLDMTNQNHVTFKNHIQNSYEIEGIHESMVKSFNGNYECFNRLAKLINHSI